MGLRINTNVPSLVAQRNLSQTRGALDRTFERLSSGLRINRASDDAAGLAISETLRAQTRGLAQAERNAQDGISVIQVAEGALSEVSNILIRLRELGVQTSSDTMGDSERAFANIEFQQLLHEIDRIANSTEYNHSHLLNGSQKSFEIQVGTQNNPLLDRISIFDRNSSDINTSALGLNLASIDTKLNAQSTLESIDSALNSVSALRAELGAVQNRLQSAINNIVSSKENLTAANSRIRDMDVAEETSALTKNQILMQSGVAVLSQANSISKTILSLLGQGT